MPRIFAAILMLGLTSNVCFAGEGDDQASSFANIYASYCLKNISNLEALREKMKPVAKLPPEKAAAFLAGKPGDAWPVADKHGSFVLALPGETKVCTVHGRRASTEAARKLFTALVGNAPAPLVTKQVNGDKAQTVSYEWSDPKSTRKMLFTLTTAPATGAQHQVVASAALVSQ